MGAEGGLHEGEGVEELSRQGFARLLPPAGWSVVEVLIRFLTVETSSGNRSHGLGGEPVMELSYRMGSAMTAGAASGGFSAAAAAGGGSSKVT